MRFHAGRAGTALAAIVAAAALSGTGVAGAEKAAPLDVKAFDFGFSGVPAQLDAGRYRVELANVGGEPHVIDFFQLTAAGAELSDEGLLTAVDNDDFSIVAGAPGGVFADVGATKRRKVEFVPGEYAYFCFVGNQNGPHYRQGMFGRMTVTE